MSAPEQHSPEVAPAGLGELVRCLVRARWLLALWMLAGLLVAVAWTARATPLFRARATVLIEQQSGSGLLGDLAMLASIGSAPATASELSVLESRSLAEEVLAEGVGPDGAWNPDDERRLGLTVLVDDAALRPVELVRRRLLDPPPPDEPLVLPPRGLAARVTSAAADAPQRVRLEFTGPGRVRVSTVGLKQSLRLASRRPEELELREGRLEYRGLALELAPWGAVEGAVFTLEVLPRHEALRRLRERISVRETSLNSGVIEVAVVDTDPRRAARTVNALCASYLSSLARRGQRRASRTVEYVQGLLDEEIARFDAAQQEVLRLQQSHPELIAPEGAAGTLIQQMATLEVERVQVELSERAFREIVAALEAGDRRALARIDDTMTADGVLADPLTMGLLEELARLDAQASTLGADLLDGHPLVEQNQAATDALVERTRAQLASRIEGLERRRTDLARAGLDLRARLAEMPDGMRQMAEAQVQFGIHRELVPYLLKSLQGAEITRSSAETWAEVVDPAVPPDELAAPDLVRWLALGLLAGLGAGVAHAFGRERQRGRVHTGEELGQALGAEFVAVVTRLSTEELAFRSHRTGPTAETIRRLRGALRFARDGSTRRVVGVSEIGEASAPTLAAELALAFAGEGRRTLLVEARPAGLARRMGLEEGPGLAEHLVRGADWRELVHAGGEGAPDVLLCGKTDEPPGDLLARPALERFLAEASQGWEAVVLALPEADALPAVPALTRAVDALCIVHRARTRARARVAEAARALRAAGARELSGVLVERR